MGRIIAIANQKGGVGKTTTAINLSAALAQKGKKVLVIDIDPQGNTTSGFGIDKNELDYTVYELILGECSIHDCIEKDVIPNVSVLASNVNLAAAEIELIGVDTVGSTMLRVGTLSIFLKLSLLLQFISFTATPRIFSLETTIL